jgi:hypothetical protein
MVFSPRAVRGALLLSAATIASLNCCAIAAHPRLLPFEVESWFNFHYDTIETRRNRAAVLGKERRMLEGV